jgi:protein involved in polysaccharide export with SLBB domain
MITVTLQKTFRYGFAVLLALLCGALAAADVKSDSAAPDASVDTLNAGDKIRVILADIPVATAPVEQQIPDSGKLTLHLNQSFQFAGKKRDELEQEIRKHYIEKGLYKNIVVTIEVLPRPITVGGQVRAAGQFAHPGKLTVLKAIDLAGGFNDFAKKTDVKIMRANGTVLEVNCKKALKNPTLDLPVYPGDKVHVEKGIW